MHRSKGLLAISLAASLLGSSVAWAVALCIVPPGAYQIAMDIDGDRLAIRLDRIAPADRRHHPADAPTVEADGLHDEHEVTLATLEACFTADSGSSAKFVGPAATLAARLVAATQVAVPRRDAGTSRASPLPFDSFTILRI
jgi:hypothetical protein